MSEGIAVISACAHRLYLYRPELLDEMKKLGGVTVFGPEPQEAGEKGLKPHGIGYVSLPLERRRADPFAETKAKALIVKTVRERNIGLVYSYGIRFAPLANNCAKAAGIPCMNVINGAGNLFIAKGIKGAVKRALILPYIRYSLRYSSRIVFQNDDDREMFRALRLGRSDRYMNVNGSGVNTARFPVFPLPEDRVFGFLGRVNPEKGVDELLRAFKNVLAVYPDARLLIAGESDGIAGTPTETLLNGLCETGAAVYLGEISDTPEFFKKIRCFVFPSYREGTPRVNLEAMSCGRPVITTDATGCRETVTDGVNGILVKPRDVETLTNAMLRLCENGEEAAMMGQNSRKTAEIKFNVHNINSELIASVKELIQRT